MSSAWEHPFAQQVTPWSIPAGPSLRSPRPQSDNDCMSKNDFSAAPLLSGVFALRGLILAVSLGVVGCAGLPFLGERSPPTGADTAAAVSATPESTRAEPPAPAAAAPAAGRALTRPAAPALADANVGDPPDAVPRVERIPQREPNLPYVVRGDAYEPESDDVVMNETGVASWYDEPFHGRRTANGEVYDMNLMTAAHKTMPLPSYAVVRNRRTGKEIVVRVNDRGPFKYDRVIDLSRAAARKLGFTGLADVEVRRLTHADIRTGTWKQARQTLASAGP